MVLETLLPSYGLNVSSTKELKLIVVGGRKVGKSALVVRFLTRRFINEYTENTDMICSGRVQLDGELLQINIQDSSEKSMRVTSLDHHSRWADGMVLVFSLVDVTSFQQLQILIQRFKSKKQTFTTPLILIGNKSDVAQMTRRQVTSSDAVELARQLRCDYYEVSAREASVTMVMTSRDNEIDRSLLMTSIISDDVISNGRRKRSNSTHGLASNKDDVINTGRLKRWSSSQTLMTSPSTNERRHHKNSIIKAIQDTLQRVDKLMTSSLTSSENEGSSDIDEMRHHRHRRLIKSPKFVRRRASSCKSRRDDVIITSTNFNNCNNQKQSKKIDDVITQSRQSSALNDHDVIAACLSPFIALCREAKKRRDDVSNK